MKGHSPSCHVALVTSILLPFSPFRLAVDAPQPRSGQHAATSRLIAGNRRPECRRLVSNSRFRMRSAVALFAEPFFDPAVARTGPAVVFAKAVGAVFALRGCTCWLFAVFGGIGFADGVSAGIFVGSVGTFAR